MLIPETGVKYAKEYGTHRGSILHAYGWFEITEGCLETCITFHTRLIIFKAQALTEMYTDFILNAEGLTSPIYVFNVATLCPSSSLYVSERQYSLPATGKLHAVEGDLNNRFIRFKQGIPNNATLR